MRVKGKAKTANRLNIKVQTATYLERAQYQALKALSGKTKVPMQAYIRAGVNHVLANDGKVKL